MIGLRSLQRTVILTALLTAVGVPGAPAALVAGGHALGPSVERASSHGLLRRALLATALGDHGAAAGQLEEALALQEAAGDLHGRAECSWMLGAVRSRQGRHREALELYDRARELYREADDPIGLWLTAYGTAELEGWLGHLDTAEASARAGLDALAEQRRRCAAGEPLRLDSLVGFAYALGIRPEMVESALEVVPPETVLDMPETLQRTTLGVLQRERGDWRRALENLERARALAQRSRLLLPRVINRLGEVHLSRGGRGDLDAAEAAFREARELSRDLPGTVAGLLRWLNGSDDRRRPRRETPEARDSGGGWFDGLMDGLVDTVRDGVVRALPDVLDATGASGMSPIALLRADELQALTNLSRAALARGDLDRCERLLGESRDLAGALGDEGVELALDLEAARLATLRGGWDAAARGLRDLVDRARSRDLPLLEVQALGELATLRLAEGRFEEALRGQLRALTRAEELGLDRRRAALLGAVAETRLQLGDAVTAAREISRARALAAANGDRPVELDLLLSEARLLQEAGRGEPPERRRELAGRAAERCGRAATLARDLGWTIREAQALVCRGTLRAAAGRPIAARRDLEAALDRARTVGDRTAETAALLALGDLALGEDRPADAERRFRRAEELSRSLGSSGSRTEGPTANAAGSTSAAEE
ncbi:MAG: tetratricopeptide repeat protein, partial [Acidobacteriota bacterium]